ncbi:MAG: tetratricopeptide repeat-containing sensor histidine kinase [Candidatus Cloacimonetes bacterium]|nr:tetratricopeptide repeat-containing sensor histidine kinase [Candidatus Cloacimonadota bacterium]
MERKAFLERINNSEGIEKIRALLAYSRYLRQPDPLESCAVAGQALKLAEELNDSYLIKGSIVNIAYANFYGSNFQEAESWANRLLKIGVKEKSGIAIGTAYNLKGNVAHRLDDQSRAIDCFLKALDYFLELQDKSEMMSCYNNLGMVHQRLAEVDEAYNYYNLALQIAEEINNPARHSIRMNMANTLFNQEKYSEALEIYLKSLEYFHEQDLRDHEANVNFNIGFCYSRLEKLDKSLEYFQRAYNLHKEINDPNSLSKTCSSLASLYLELDKPDSAIAYLEESMQLAQKHNLKSNILACYDVYAQYYTRKKDYLTAIEYLRKLLIAKEELHQENSREKLIELETKYKTQIYKLKSTELDEKNRTMSNQIEELNATLQNLQGEFQKAAVKMNAQDNLLTSQSRMALMGEMVSAIAHQWRQPLNVIGLLTQSIGDAWDYDELSEEFLKKQIETISGQIQYMNETINDFRNFFKPDFIIQFSIAEIIEKALDLQNFLLKKEEITIEKELDNQCQLSGNPNELIQVILNIINNAREAMERDSIKNRLLRLKLEHRNKQIIISIYNNGKPIASEHMEKLFEPYFTTRGDEGTGIGLHICRLIIENKFQGKIEAVNHIDGVEFIITMACKLADPGKAE